MHGPGTFVEGPSSRRKKYRKKIQMGKLPPQFPTKKKNLKVLCFFKNFEAKYVYTKRKRYCQPQSQNYVYFKSYLKTN
jgi:hypothetical protein